MFFDKKFGAKLEAAAAGGEGGEGCGGGGGLAGGMDDLGGGDDFGGDDLGDDLDLGGGDTGGGDVGGDEGGDTDLLAEPSANRDDDKKPKYVDVPRKKGFNNPDARKRGPYKRHQSSYDKGGTKKSMLGATGIESL
jgi:hypothetical protein